MFSPKYNKEFSLSSFKDPDSYRLLGVKIYDDIKNYSLELPNWEFVEEEDYSGENTLKRLTFLVNKPETTLKSLFKPKNPFKQEKNPYLEVKIHFERVSQFLRLTIVVSEGGIRTNINIPGMKKILTEDPFMSSFKIKRNDFVKELTTNIQNKISSIVFESINEFEKNRVEKNIEVKNEVLDKIKKLEYNEEISKTFISNQSLFNDEHIQKILKVLEFYENNLNNYSNTYEKFNDKDFVNEFQSEINETIELLLPTYNSVLVIESYISEMINSLIKGDKVTYFSIYNVFEDQGVFLTKGEKIMIDNTNKLSEQLNQLNSSMDTLISLTVDISEKLSRINGQLKINNLLTGINTYQLHSINKKLK